MAKFINKKEQVYDLKLTSYGHYLLSVGTFKPVYYAFFDDNVLYDKQYAFASATENQNDVDNRIKNETQYLESLVLFRDVEATQDDTSLRSSVPAKDIFKLDMMIGDALLDGEANHAPAWKVVGLQGIIATSSAKDERNNTQIPQINIDANYRKRVVEDTFNFDPSSVRVISRRSNAFIDGNIIEVAHNDPLYYIEELNTELLTKNFDVKVFEVLTSSISGAPEKLQRKYFNREIPQVQDGFLVSETKKEIAIEELTSGSVEYYFDVLLDDEIEQELACKGALAFNKQSYYVDLDFDCDKEEEESLFYDIYGVVTEPEICQD